MRSSKRVNASAFAALTVCCACHTGVSGDDSHSLRFARECFSRSRIDQQMQVSALKAHPIHVLEAHRKELWEATSPWRGLPVHRYRGYGGPWIENLWIERFSPMPQAAFGAFVPIFVQWVDYYHVQKYRRGKAPSLRAGLRTLSELMRPDIPYITVSQHDHGILNPLLKREDKKLALRLTNLLVLSSGGNGHVPIPLLKQPEEVVPFPPGVPRKVLTFVGGVDGLRPSRVAVKHELLNTAALTQVQQAGVLFQRMNASSGNWRQTLAESSLVLTPRGQGRAAYSMYETIQMGMVPVYVWDDFEWLPYHSTHASWSNFGFSVRVGSFAEHAPELWAASNTVELQRRRDKLLSLRESHFTYNGVMSQIAHLLVNGTSGEGSSDLRCSHRAPLGGPFCPAWTGNFYAQNMLQDCAPRWYPSRDLPPLRDFSWLHAQQNGGRVPRRGSHVNISWNGGKTTTSLLIG